MQLAAGVRIGDYEIVAPLGAGGMGEVYRARDLRIGREVAIKVLPAAVGADADRLRRFEQEARTAGSLNHPNLVTVYELGAHEGRPFIAMELLEGETLRAKLESSRVALRKTTEYAVQIANGLAAAHEKSIIHRDLKPENIFITRDGRVKVLDFGLAKLKSSDGALGPNDATLAREGTDPGTVMGTAGYMSPEQVRAQPVDQRSDIFSFGAIVYEMLTGRRAFRRSSSVETLNAILSEEPPELSATGLQVPPALERIVRRCLEKSPDERFYSAHDMALVLESMSGSAEQRLPAVRGRSWGRIAIPIMAALVAVLLTLVIARALGYRRPRASAPAAEPRFTPLTLKSGVEEFPSLAPDGRTFVFTKGGDIFLQRVGGQNAINLTEESLSNDYQPAFSPDGTRIAFRSDRDGGGIFLMGATGESVRRLTDFGYNPSWSPDGSRIAVATEVVVSFPWRRNTMSRIFVVDVKSGASRALTVPDAVQPVWSPDGRRIAFWARDASGQRDIYTVLLDGGAPPAAVTSDAATDWNPAWSPDGFLYFGSDRAGAFGLARVLVDPATGRAAGPVETIGVPSRFSGHFSLSRDGRQIAFMVREQTDQIIRVDVDLERARSASKFAVVLSGSLRVNTFTISPDGQWIAFSTLGAQEDLYLVRSDGSEMRQITSDMERDRSPSWTPDGREIYFYSSRSGRYEIFKVRPDGSNLTRVLGMPEEGAFMPNVSPDGRLLSFFTERGTHLLDLRSPAKGPDTLPIPPENPDCRFRARAWSPDGRTLSGALIRSDATFHSAIMIYSISGRTYRQVAETYMPLIDTENFAVFAGNDRLVYVDSGHMYILDIHTKVARDLDMPSGGAGEPLLHSMFALSPDRKAVYVLRNLVEGDIWMATLPP